MKVEVEFEEIESLKITIERLREENAALETKINSMSEEGVLQQARIETDKYLRQFFDALGIECNGETEFWSAPPHTRWSGTCYLSLSIGKDKEGNPLSSASVRFWE